MTAMKVGPRLLIWLLLGGLLASYVAVRVIPPWQELVRPEGTIVLPGNDEWFHYRQALYTNEHFPRLQRYEDVGRYPQVERVEAVGLWNLTLAGIARGIALGAPSAQAVGWVCLWAPPVGGALALLVLFLVIRVHGSPALGLWLVSWGVLNAAGTFTRTGMGFCDHHVAEMILSLWCLLALLRLLAAGAAARRWWRPAWSAALPFALFLFTWVGAPLYLFLMAGVLALAAILATIAGVRALPVTITGTRLLLGVLVLAGLPAALWPDLVMKPKYFMAALVGAGLAAGALPILGWVLDRASARLGPGWAGLGALSIISAGLVACGLWSTTAAHYAGLLLDRRTPYVAEHAAVNFSSYFQMTGVAGVLALAAPAVGILTGAWKRPGWIVTVAWSMALLLLWYRTWDFDYLAGLHALVLTGAMLGAWASARESAGKTSVPVPALTGMTAVMLLLIWPLRISAFPFVTATWYRERAVLAHAGWQQAMAWLREQPPPPPDFSADLPRGCAGVLVDWSMGNVVNTLGGWPAVAARFPDVGAAAPFWLEAETAVRAAALRGSTVAATVRYVALDARMLGDQMDASLRIAGRNPAEFMSGEPPRFSARWHATLAYRLVVRDGNGLGHFRLVYESPSETFLRQRYDHQGKMLVADSTRLESSGRREEIILAIAAGAWNEDGRKAFDGALVPSVRLFEQVAGARVTGRGLPGEEVEFSLPLHVVTTGRRFTYRQATQCDSEGNFVLNVPYATGPMTRSEVQAVGPARLVAGGRIWPVHIPEQLVQSGAAVRLDQAVLQ